MDTMAFEGKKHLRYLAFEGHNEFAAQTLPRCPYHAKVLAAHASQTPIVPLKSKKRVKRLCAHCEKTFVSIVVKSLRQTGAAGTQILLKLFMTPVIVFDLILHRKFTS
jgi:hypothetical protein